MQIEAWGRDGCVVIIWMPSELDVSKLVSTSKKQYRSHLESCKHIPDIKEVSGPKDAELSKIPIELKCGTKWLHGRIEIDGYEEYIGTEYRSARCFEEYKVIEWDFRHAGEDEYLILEGDIGGGLVLQWKISIQKDDPKILHIDSSTIAQKVGAGSGEFS
ncbi:hypothetical protein P3X46_032186, partial [Hevea brasiliensis]